MITGEPTWHTLSKLCPNAGYDQTVCEDIAFFGKEQNEEIGKFVREQGWRGVFPWAANYDDVGSTTNNTMSHWLGKGLKGGPDQRTEY